MPPAARITDFHACPMVTPGTPPIPHVGGPIIKGSFNVLTGKLPQVRVGDMAVCVGPPDTIVKGSSGVFVNKMPAARIGDSTAHGGTIVAGLPTVIIGESKSISGGGAAVPKGALMLAYSDFVAQLKVLIDAQRTGAPFCEACFKAAQAEANEEALIASLSGGLKKADEQPLAFASHPASPPAAGARTPAQEHVASQSLPAGRHPPMALPTNTPRTWTVATLTAAQDTARADPAFQPANHVTHCNQALVSMMNELGAPTTGLVDAQGNALRANAMTANLATSPDYRAVTPEEAQRLANNGSLVIAARANPGGSGHVAPVRPSGVEGDVITGNSGPILSNVGSSVGVMRQSLVFRRDTPPTYYVLDQ